MKCLAQTIAEKSRGQDARPQTDGCKYHIPPSSPTAMAGDKNTSILASCYSCVTGAY